MRTLHHLLHSGSLFPLFWLTLLPCCAPPPSLLCSPLSLLVWLPRSVCLCCSSPCLVALLGAHVAHPLLMARSACAAFGGCCSARTSWFPCVLLCVLLGLVSLPCVGRPCAQLFCCLPSSQFRALSFSAGTLTAFGVRRRGGSMSLPASHCGCRVVPLANTPPPPEGRGGCLGPWPAPADRPTRPHQKNCPKPKNKISQRGPKFEADF